MAKSKTSKNIDHSFNIFQKPCIFHILWKIVHFGQELYSWVQFGKVTRIRESPQFLRCETRWKHHSVKWIAAIKGQLIDDLDTSSNFDSQKSTAKQKPAKHSEAAVCGKNNLHLWNTFGECFPINDFDRSRNVNPEKPNAELKPWKLSEANIWWKANMVKDVSFREKHLVDDWVIKKDYLNGTKIANGIRGRVFRWLLTHQE
jgi:hypothetical protein